MRETPQRYADPIIAGFGLGLVLLLTILVTGRGLGASGAFATAAAATVAAVAPAHAAAHPYLADRVPSAPGGLLGDWLVIELLAAAFGAWASARFTGRLQRNRSDGQDDRGTPRLVRAVAGGLLMGGGARLAHGCTSGLALTGGAMLSTGAWLFIPFAFGSAFLTAFALRRFARTGVTA